MKRKELEKVLEEKKAAEKREKWLRELEERDREDREWRGRFEDVAARAKEAEEGAKLRLRVGKGKREKKVVEGGGGVVEEMKNSADQTKGGVVEQVKNGADQSKENLQGTKAVAEQVKEGAKQGKEGMKQAIEKAFQNKSILEQVQISGWWRGTWFIREAWRRR